MKTVPPLSVVTTSLPQTNKAGQSTAPLAGEGKALAPLSHGQILRATVVSTEPNNQYTLESGTTRHLVHSKVPLTSGQSIDLQVVSSGPQIKLQMIPETVSQLFGRSLASSGNNQDLSSFFSLLRQTGTEQLPNLSSAALKSLQEFSQLQQQSLPGSAASPTAQVNIQGPSASQLDFGQKVLSHILNQLGEQISNLPSTGKEQTASSTLKTAFQDIALLFQQRGQLTPATQSQVNNLAQEKQQIFELLSVLQQNGKDGAKSDALINRLLQTFQVQPQTLTNAATSQNSLNTLKAGFSDLLFLLKGPQGVLQLLSNNSMQSGLLTQSNLESMLSSSSTTATAASEEGDQLQQLIHSLGLDLEGKLAAGNVKDAGNTVKSGLMELVQNFLGQNKLAEGGKQALSTIEFYQLTQLQLERQDSLVLPIPLPFLEQGYLVIDDYKKQFDGEDGDKESLTHFSLYLKLEPLGNLKIDFLYSGEGVYIRFNSDSKEISDFLADFKTELSDSISNTVVQGVSFGEGGGKIR